MSAVRLGPDGLLEYNASHGVLICRECQYAIQKGALQRHLLGHRIYRKRRQHLLSSIAQLHLFEPHDVPLPAPASPPIESLPIISGYRCAEAGCGHLCASSKRMRRHLSEVHGHTDPPNSSSLFGPAKLQTFFRGTKLKYFEVTLPPVAGTLGAVLSPTLKGDNPGGTREQQQSDQRRNEQVGTVDTTIQPQPARTPAPLGVPPELPRGVDLETLIYFHNFITSTSLTLPCAEHEGQKTHYWQTNFVLQALGRRWLMCGLLAISACHLATTTSDDTASEQTHRRHSEQFLAEFSAGWEEISKQDSAAMAADVEEEQRVRTVGRQLRCLLRCAYWASRPSTLGQESPLEMALPFHLHSIMSAFQAFSFPSSTQESNCVPHDDDHHPEGAFNGMTRSSLNADTIAPIQPGHDVEPSEILVRLHALPFRMAETFGKPENGHDVLAMLSAIATLSECCNASFASHNVGGTYQAMVTWLSKVPDRFSQLVSRQDVAALVVLAYGAALLVGRVEQCGGWFLSGLAKTILLQIMERLSTAHPPAQDLVRCLMV